MKNTFNMSLKFKIMSLGFGTNLALILGTFLGVQYAISSLYWIMGGILIFSLGIFYVVGTRLSDVIENITLGFSTNSASLKSAAAKMAEGSTQLSSSTLEQSSALQETVSTVDQISSMIRNNRESAGKSKDLSAKSKNSAEQGRQTVDSMLMAIGEIESNNTELSQQMKNSNIQLSEITNMIHQISNKTKVINEIVFQTKLLSFNASVEAARAGEYGKGFAVVASEVGKLAQMSGGAAKEITDMLQESVTRVEGIAEQTKEKLDKLMNSSEEKINYGTETAKQCKEALNEILESVDAVDKLIYNITTASQEQELGIQVISQAMNMLEKSTHQNTTFSQNSSTSAEQLKSQATALSGYVEDLTGYVHGTRSVGQGSRSIETRNKPAIRQNEQSSKSSSFKGSFSGKSNHSGAKNHQSSPTKKLSLVKSSKFKSKQSKSSNLIEPLKKSVQIKETKAVEANLSLVNSSNDSHEPLLQSASGYTGKIPSASDPGFGDE